jgi:predicted transcriptional regulator
MNNSGYVLLSIRPEYALKILDGTKTVELRRRFPRSYQHGRVILYISHPVKAIVGGFHISRIMEGDPDAIWEAAGTISGISREKFNDYYFGTANGYAIFIDRVWRYKTPIPLDLLRQDIPNFTVPQSFRYICKDYADSHLKLTTPFELRGTM